MRPFAGLRRALALTVLLATSHGADPLPGGLTLTENTLVPSSWVHGMIERRFVIENPTPQTHSVQLTLPASAMSGKGLDSLSLAVLANAGTRTLATMHQPPTMTRGTGVRVTVGRLRPRNITCQQIYLSDKRYYSTHPINLLVSKGLSAEDLKTRLIACAATNTTSRHDFLRGDEVRAQSNHELTDRLFNWPFLEQLKPCRFEGEGTAWPRHWLAYSAFDGCLVAASDYERMPEAARGALRDYASAGGHVTFVGLASLPEAWTSSAGATTVSSVSSGHQSPREAEVGFGRVCALGAGSSSAIASDDIRRLASAWVAGARTWLEPHKNPFKAIPVAQNLRVPARSFLVILAVFTLLAGPGAVIFTRRANRRIWLLGLVPAFSLIFSLAILAYALLSEGITPSLRRQAVTWLDQTRQHASTLGAVGVYAPVSLRDGLHFDAGTEVTPLSPVRAGRIDLGRSQHYAVGWVQPRMPACFRLRRSETRVERLLVIRRETGATEVVNALGAPILRMKLCDRQGTLHVIRDLAPGEKRALDTPQPRRAGARPARQAVQLHGQANLDAGWNLNTLADEVLNDSRAPIEPEAGSYVAVLDGAPFLEDPLAYCRTRATARSVVVGWYGGE